MNTRRVQTGLSVHPLLWRVAFVCGMVVSLLWLIVADPVNWENGGYAGDKTHSLHIRAAQPTWMPSAEPLPVFAYHEDTGDWACEFEGNHVCSDRRRGAQ